MSKILAGMVRGVWSWQVWKAVCRWVQKSGCIAAIPFLLVNCASQQASMPSPAARISPAISTGLFGDWDKLGYQQGDIVADFVLYSEEGRQFRLSDELLKGKPIVLSGASYTCDISRRNFPAVRSLWKKYGQDIAFYVVYTTEAHPVDVRSPYSPDGRVWLADANIRDKVEAEQPKTYKERIELSRIFKSRNYVPIEILVDTPSNYFWKNFGQAPNMIYVILPNNKVYYKQTWFEENEIDQYLAELLDD